MNLKPEERQKVSTPNGSWFCNIDKNQIAYVLLTNPNYPERHAYGMIRVLKYKYLSNIILCEQECHGEIEKIPNYFAESDVTISAKAKTFLPNIAMKFDDLKKIDKLFEAQNTVDEISRTMTTNLSKVMNNTENLHVKVQSDIY